VADLQLPDNLNWLRERLEARRPEQEMLRALLQCALEEGDAAKQILRISPHRTVLKIAHPLQDDGDAWVLKIYHPRRAGEALRNRVREAPALREHENLRLLESRLELPLAGFAEQLTAQVGVVARPFLHGRPAGPNRETAWGLARLHGARWTDRDAALDDFIFPDFAPDTLVPLDLGHARVRLAPVSIEDVHRCLIRVLAGLDGPQTDQFAALLLESHLDLLPGWEVRTLTEKARQQRRQRAWKRSRRALRDCSDFVKTSRGARRRSCGTPPTPKEWEALPALSDGPRSRSARVGDWVWKFYQRDSWSEAWRRRLGDDPAQRAYRRLAALEILGIPACLPGAFAPARHGSWLATSFVAGRLAGEQDLEGIARWLGSLHNEGFGLRDAKPSNFILDSAAQLQLIDADGIRLRLWSGTRGIDLARVLAEVPAGSEREQELQAAYQAVAGQLTESELRLGARRARIYRSKLGT